MTIPSDPPVRGSSTVVFVPWLLPAVVFRGVLRIATWVEHGIYRQACISTLGHGAGRRSIYDPLRPPTSAGSRAPARRSLVLLRIVQFESSWLWTVECDGPRAWVCRLVPRLHCSMQATCHCGSRCPSKLREKQKFSKYSNKCLPCSLSSVPNAVPSSKHRYGLGKKRF
jgi:hypothetical protein